MHCEKNFSANLIGYILGDKDTVAVRKDMQAVGVTPHLHLQATAIPGTYLMPNAPYALSASDKGSFKRLLSSTKTPTGYVSSLSKHIDKLSGLKSHDYHVLVQQILPACIRNFLHPGARDAVVRVGNVFKKICAKVIDKDSLSDLMTYTAETLCLLEIWFPPGFWDIMPHLMIHLVEEVGLLGPVHSRWCYGVERYLYFMKKTVRNRYRPEASMAKAFVTEESLNYVTDFTILSEHLRRRIWDIEDEDINMIEKLEGARKKVKLTERERSNIHIYVLWNSVPTISLRR
jgi:hypothetical protein